MPLISYSQDFSKYLIPSDIGAYKFRPKRVVTIGNAGVLVPTGHFADHGDMTYEGIYIHPQTYLGVSVQVTQHAGSDSDKWLLHEVERGFRDTDNLEAGPDEDSMIRVIDGKKIYFYGGGVVGYRWLSGNVVVNIQYSNLGGPKPEPIEVVQAYLAKFPSTITMTDTEFKSKAHTETWLKDEMERRLWLADKWTATIQPPTDQQPEDPKLPQKLKTIVDNLNIFLDYRQKYYNIAANNEKRQLEDYRNKKDKAAIQGKLNEYKTWWSANKTGTINLP